MRGERKCRRRHHLPMTPAGDLQFLLLDEEWRPLGRLDGRSDWRDIANQLLCLQSQWLIVEQRREAGDAFAPRRQDIHLCRTLSRRLRAMEIKLADHVIRGQSGRFSFREAGLL